MLSLINKHSYFLKNMMEQWKRRRQCGMFTAAKKSSEANFFVILICMTFAKQLQIDRMFTKMESWLLAFVNISRIWSYLCTLHFMPAYMMIGMGTAVDHGFHSILMALSKKKQMWKGEVGNGAENYTNKVKRNSGYNIFLNLPHFDCKMCSWPALQPKLQKKKTHPIWTGWMQQWQ